MIHDDTAPHFEALPDAPHHDPLHDDVDAVYDAFLPHLISARRSYVRRRLGVVLLLPIVAIAGVAYASTEEAPAQVATEVVEEPVERVADEPVDPEPEAAPARGSDTDEPEELALVETEDEPEAEPDWTVVELGEVGTAQVAKVDGELVLGELDLAEGWEGALLAFGSADTLLVELTDGEAKLVATVDGDLAVELLDFTPESEPEVQTRKEIAVGDVGTVVVEREADTLFMDVTWSHEWWTPTVVTAEGARVYATFENDGVVKHVEAWIDDLVITHGVWVTEPEPEKGDEHDKTGEDKTGEDKTGDDKKTDEKDEKGKETDEEVQTRKEIHVGDVGKVVVERDGEKLWLGVLWSHEYYDAVVVTEHGTLVQAYFTNDGVEHHVKAWIEGAKIKTKKWVVEPQVEPYDGTVSCGLGNVGVLVEGNIARIMSVQEVEGVEWEIKKEVGEYVKVKFYAEGEQWLLEAWGNGESVVAECTQVG